MEKHTPSKLLGVCFFMRDIRTFLSPPESRGLALPNREGSNVRVWRAILPEGVGSSRGLVRVALSDWQSLLVFLSLYQEEATYVSHRELGGESLFQLARRRWQQVSRSIIL